MYSRQNMRSRQRRFGMPARAVVIRIGDPAEARRGYEVTDPARLFRIWTTLKSVHDELRATRPDAVGDVRAAWLLDRLREELGRSVSAALAAELDDLLPAGATDVRISYAGLLGWTESLVSSMLLQFTALTSTRPYGGGRSDQGPWGPRPRRPTI